MNLLFCIDRGFIPLLGTCVRSILKNGGYERYEAYVLHSDLTQADQAAIRRFGGERMHFTFLTVQEELFEGFPSSERYPRQIYYRLIAPLLLPRDMERILYLDVDTVVVNPLTELETLPFGDAWFMACTHVRYALSKLNQVRLGMDLGKDTPYLNSGVILYNLPAFREGLDIARIRDYAEEKKNALVLPDQDILTAVCGEHVRCAITSATGFWRSTTPTCAVPSSTPTGCGETASSSTTAARTSRGTKTTAACSTYSTAKLPPKKNERSPQTGKMVCGLS